MVLRLRLHRAGGPSGIRAEHLSMWICAATREERPAPGSWEKVIAIIQAALGGGGGPGALCLADGGGDPQGGRHQLQRDWPSGGPVEGDIRHHKYLDSIFHTVP